MRCGNMKLCVELIVTRASDRDENDDNKLAVLSENNDMLSRFYLLIEEFWLKDKYAFMLFDELF